jgi:P4 family phage/plasmid primase-like protien
MNLSALQQAAAGGLSILTLYPQWVVWRPVPPVNPGDRWKKELLSPNGGYAASSTDSTTWSDYHTALIYATEHDLGVGFVFTAEDPFFFVDVDNCYHESSGWSPLAVELCQRLQGCFIEASVSGTGLHIIGIGKRPDGYKVKSDIGFDVYEWGRWAALTGSNGYGDASFDHSAEINRIVTSYMRPKETGATVDWAGGPVPEWSGYTDDAELIQAARRSKSVAATFTGKATFDDLWTANAEALTVSYPHDATPDTFDHSAADAALCQHLAFWTGKDCGRIDRLFRQSALMRDKWADRPQYVTDTIAGAVARCRSVHQRPAVPEALTQASVVAPPPSVAVKPRYASIVSGQGVYGDGKDTQNAATFIQCWYPDNTLVFVAEQGYRFNGQVWELVDNQTLIHEMTIAMWAAEPKDATISSAFRILQKHRTAPHLKPGQWIGRDTSHLVACQNGILDVHTGQLEPHNPQFFTTGILPYSYDPHATAPQWQSFLVDIFEGDVQRIALLQEWLGYQLVNDYSHHKAMLLVGAPRSGKGTIGRILNSLVGSSNYMGMTLDGFADNKTMEAALTKTVLFIGDAHSVSGPDKNRILDRLMSITGNDSLTIGRLYKQSFSGQLPGRITIAANSIPTFYDDSGAFGNRLLLLPFNKSALGNEDPTLLNRLLTEMPGICNWAIEGLQRLRATGRFTEPAICREERDDMLEQQAPLLTFIRQECDIAPMHTVSTADLYNRYVLWCTQNGQKAGGHNRFTRELKSTLRAKGVVKKPVSINGRTVNGFEGLSLKAVDLMNNVASIRA